MKAAAKVEQYGSICATASIRLLSQLAPLARLDADNQLVSAIAVRLEH
jgi:hypothetical protein